MDRSFHLQFLRRAVDLSRQSLNAGGFPVAALLVRNGQEIAHGFSCTETTHDVTAHGEISAIRAAGASAISPLTLYSSLEPCLMCLAASVWAGVTEIVYGCRKEKVNEAYYISKGKVEDTANLLYQPPRLLYFEEFEKEILELLNQYGNRHRQ